MNDPFRTVLDMARKLSLDERIGLADILYAEAAMPVEEWEAAWAKECESRMAALDRGEMQLIDADEVHAALEAKYGPL
jgi:hypothetical protein